MGAMVRLVAVRTMRIAALITGACVGGTAYGFTEGATAAPVAVRAVGSVPVRLVVQIGRLGD